MSDSAAWDDMVLVGRVARVHGLRGQVIVNPDTDFPEDRYEPGRVVYRERDGRIEPLKIQSCRFHRGRPIVAFEGIEAIEAAEPLAGAELRIPAEWLEPLPENAYYVHDLVGCRVEVASGGTVGVVERVDGEGVASRLVVATPQGEVLVPLVADICRRVDVVAKAIVIDPPEGLLDVNPERRVESGRSRRGRR